MGPRVWFSHLLSFLCLIKNYRASPGHPQSCCGLAVRTVLLVSEEKTRGVCAFLNREMGIAVQAASDKETQQHLQEACRQAKHYLLPLEMYMRGFCNLGYPSCSSGSIQCITSSDLSARSPRSGRRCCDHCWKAERGRQSPTWSRRGTEKDCS